VENAGWSKVYDDYATYKTQLDDVEADIQTLEARYNSLKKNVEDSNANLETLNNIVTAANAAAAAAENYTKYELVQYDVLSVISDYKTEIAKLQAEYTAAAKQGLLYDTKDGTTTTYTEYLSKVNDAVADVDSLAETATELEYSALLDAINLLKSDFNSLTDDKKASIGYQTVQKEINAIQNEYDVLTYTNKPDYTYPTTAVYPTRHGEKNYDIYIDLESRIAKQRADMPGNLQKITDEQSEALAGVNALLDSINAEIADLKYAGYDLLGKVEKETAAAEIADYQAQLDELKTQASDFKTSLEKISGGSLLVLVENKTIADKQKELEDDYKDLAEAIADSKDPYQVNYDSYKAALDKLEASEKVLQEAKKTVGEEFAEKTIVRGIFGYNFERIQRDIDDQKDDLKDCVAGLMLADEPSELEINGHSIDEAAALFVKRYEQQQLLDNLAALKSEDGLYTEVAALIDPNSTYLTVTPAELYNELYAVDLLIQASQYNINGDHEDAIGNARYDSYNGTDFYEFVSNGPDILFSKVKEDAAEAYDDIVKALEALKEKINENQYVIGDVTKDGKVSINDYDALLDVILEKEEVENELDALRYDVNADSEINIADVQNVVAIITNQFQGLNAARRAAAADASGDAVSIQAIGEGISRKLSVLLDNAVAYTGAQFDITLPEGVTLDGASLTARTAGLEVRFNEIAKGIYRVVISSLEGLAFQGNNGSIVDLDVEVTPSYDGSGVSLANVITTDAAARAYHLDADTEATGIATVSATTYVKEKIYSVGGQLLDGLKKGVNIIRGNDGSTKKVMHK
jgi:RNA binding exosome subunit